MSRDDPKRPTPSQHSLRHPPGAITEVRDGIRPLLSPKHHSSWAESCWDALGSVAGPQATNSFLFGWVFLNFFLFFFHLRSCIRADNCVASREESQQLLLVKGDFLVLSPPLPFAQPILLCPLLSLNYLLWLGSCRTTLLSRLWEGCNEFCPNQGGNCRKEMWKWLKVERGTGGELNLGGELLVFVSWKGKH